MRSSECRTLALLKVSLCLLASTYSSVSGADAGENGGSHLLQKAFGDIIERRRRSTNDQVVKLNLRMKENKAITGLSQQEKDYLLLVHNAYRSAVQPFAANMMEMVWDDDIEALAQDWANQCRAQHRPNRNLNQWINMGENIFWSFGGKYHEGFAVKFWWDELQWFNYSTMYCQPDKQCGHYVTMTWAESSRMGCGVTRCDRVLGLPDYGLGAYFFVCNYNGRFVSFRQPYVEHRTMCSRCYKTHAKKCRYNLCVTKEMLDYDIGYNGSMVEVGFNRTKTFSSLKSPITTVTTTSLPTANVTAAERFTTAEEVTTTPITTTETVRFTTGSPTSELPTSEPVKATTVEPVDSRTTESPRSTAILSTDKVSSTDLTTLETLPPSAVPLTTSVTTETITSPPTTQMIRLTSEPESTIVAVTNSTSPGVSISPVDTTVATEGTTSLSEGTSASSGLTSGSTVPPTLNTSITHTTTLKYVEPSDGDKTYVLVVVDEILKTANAGSTVLPVYFSFIILQNLLLWRLIKY